MSQLPTIAAEEEHKLNTSSPATTTTTTMISHGPEPETQHAFVQGCQSKPVIAFLPHNSLTLQTRQVEVMKQRNPTQAYMTMPGTTPRLLNPQTPGWGEELIGIILRGVENGNNGTCFVEPSPESAETVIIKRLRKSVILETTSPSALSDNPYTEIIRMQTLGDNVHVLGCIEALEDDKFLYIITPYCDYDLTVWLGGGGMPEHHAKVIYTNLLENLAYLQTHRICHRNLTPANCKVYKGRLVFAGLGHSFRIPDGGLVNGMGTMGVPAYTPPEAYVQLPFDAHAHDLWSSAVILFNLLTGGLLCHLPIPDDILFRFFVLARGVSAAPNMELTTEVLQELEQPQQIALQKLSQRYRLLSPELLELLENIIRVAPHERWTIHDARACRWLHDILESEETGY